MQTELPVQVAAPGSGRGGWILAALLFVAVLAALGVVVLLSGRVGDEPPPEVPEFRPPDVNVLPRFEVRSVDGGRALLVADSTRGQSVDVTRELDVPGTTIERLTRSTAIPAVGQEVTVVGIWDQVHNHTIRSIVIHPKPTGGEVPVSPAGFRGHEAEIDALERPILEGVVTAVAGRAVSIRSNGEELTLTINDGAPVYELQAGSPTDLVPGARLALRDADGKVAVLVLPAESRP